MCLACLRDRCQQEDDHTQDRVDSQSPTEVLQSLGLPVTDLPQESSLGKNGQGQKCQHQHMFDHDQNAPWISEEVAKTRVVPVNQHEVGAGDQENEQRAAEKGPQAGGNLLQQVPQGVGLHLTLEDGQVDQACKDIVPDHDDGRQGVEPGRERNKKDRHFSGSLIHVHIARAAAEGDIDLVGGAVEVWRLVQMGIDLAEARVHNRLAQAGGGVNASRDAGWDAYDHVARASLGVDDVTPLDTVPDLDGHITPA